MPINLYYFMNSLHSSPTVGHKSLSSQVTDIWQQQKSHIHTAFYRQENVSKATVHKFLSVILVCNLKNATQRKYRIFRQCTQIILLGIKPVTTCSGLLNDHHQITAKNPIRNIHSWSIYTTSDISFLQCVVLCATHVGMPELKIKESCISGITVLLLRYSW